LMKEHFLQGQLAAKWSWGMFIHKKSRFEAAFLF
jgi:hypothetical protein